MKTKNPLLFEKEEIVEKINATDLEDEMKQRLIAGLTDLEFIIFPLPPLLSVYIVGIIEVIAKSNARIMTPEELRDQFKKCATSVFAEDEMQNKAIQQFEEKLAKVTLKENRS